MVIKDVHGGSGYRFTFGDQKTIQVPSFRFTFGDQKTIQVPGLPSVIKKRFRFQGSGFRVQVLCFEYLTTPVSF